MLQKYRSKGVPSPSFPQSVPSKPTIKPQQLPSVAVQSGESDLLQSIQRIQRPQGTIPILSGEADLVQFIQQIKTLHPDLSSSQLSAIISGEANSISQILNKKSQQQQQQPQKNGIPILSGSADLLEAIEFVIQKYRNQSPLYPLPLQNTITYPQSVPSQSQGQVWVISFLCLSFNLHLTRFFSLFFYRLFRHHSRIQLQMGLKRMAKQIQLDKRPPITSSRMKIHKITLAAATVEVAATENLLIPLSRISKVNFPINIRNRHKVM